MNQFWQFEPEELFTQLNTRPEGLSTEEAEDRFLSCGPNSLKPPKKGRGIALFLSQFKSPLILILIGAAGLSFFLGARLDASIICTIVLLSGLLGYFQERGALNALEKIFQIVENKTMVRRDGKEFEIPTEEVVPGDIVVLNAGDLVPADCLLFEAKHLFVDEATLTGESIPAEKAPGKVSPDASQHERTNALFFGSMVSSGFGVAIVAGTAKDTLFGEIAQRIRFRPPETAFEIGARKFGFFLMQVTLYLVIAIFAFNVYFQRPVLDSFLFSLALAVGLTPQLLPAIISVNLAHGARKMAAKRVVVKRLASIENFGQMDVLCTDKTGTITEGKPRLEKAVNGIGEKNEKCLFYAYLNAHFQAGYTNPLDKAILDSDDLDVAGWKKVDEIPYDFIRKRLSVVFEHEGKTVLIAKGAVPQMLSVCKEVVVDDHTEPMSPKVQEYFEASCEKGFRTLAVAFGEGEKEENLTLVGFLHFIDPIKEGIAEAVQELKKRGVHLKIITGDHRSIAVHVAKVIGLTHAHLVTGEEIHHASEHGLMKIAREKNLFAEIEPNQKEQLILALRKSGHIVGYLGDGINDVSALHSADVGISVDSGADAAKEASDIVLLNKDLHTLREGVEEGRHTFANTIKYVFMATSANFGNMFSMAGASLFLSFLPLLPKQVLLTNLLTDFPEMAIATDRVDADTVQKPVKWDLPFIRRFMIVFGLLSSIFDYATFAVLLFWLKADPDLFRTGWFVESVMSATLVVLVIRTRHAFFKSLPSRPLTWAILGTAGCVMAIPYLPILNVFGFVPLPTSFFLPLGAILVLYILSAEIVKRLFFRLKK
ncbi:MAG: magnesium-translocating P-type ATPase [Parachlamydiales bacterium]|nr:magnesium-translocating P-type ATPase [Parachlamydiales bacterium]